MNEVDSEDLLPVILQPPASSPNRSHHIWIYPEHRIVILCIPKTMKLTGNTSEMQRCREPDEEHIFINFRTWKRLTLRHFKKMIDKWARLLNIQKLQSIKPSGRKTLR